MFRKELQDTAKSVAGILLITLLTIAFSYFTLRQIFGFKVVFRDFLLYFSWFWMFLVVFYLGSTLFSKEKTGKNFEYFFSLPVPRWKILGAVDCLQNNRPLFRQTLQMASAKANVI